MQDRSAATQLDQTQRVSHRGVASADTPQASASTTNAQTANLKAPAQSSNREPVDLVFAATASIALWGIIVAILIWLL